MWLSTFARGAFVRYLGGVQKVTGFLTRWSVFIFAIVRPGFLPAQCAMCAKSLEAGGGSGGPNVGAGFHWGMLFLIGMVFTLVAALVGLVVYAARGATVAAAQVAAVSAADG